MTKNQERGNFNFHRYDNGLRLITVPMEHTESVVVLVMVSTGSRYETPEINGISHFLEHMMFKGTTKRPGALDITKELDSIGAEYNAFTSKEYTGYYVKCASEKIEVAMDVISDIFQNSKLDTKEIEKEKGVIVEEINMYLDTPSRYINDIFEEMLYDGQPLGFLTQGKKEIVKSLTRDNFISYFSTHYFDKNTVIAVAGNIKHEDVVLKIEKYFSNVRTEPEITTEKTKDDQTGPKLRIHNKKTDQSHFNLGFRAFGYFEEDRTPILEAIALILSGGMSSRLFQEFREKRGLAYYVHAFNNPYADVGYFAIGAGVDNSRLKEAIEVAMAECKKLIEEEVSEEELKKIKDYVSGKLAISLESSDDLASFYADQELLKKKILTPDEKLALIQKVTAKDIQETAKEVFRPEGLNLAIIGPLEDNDPEIISILNSW